MKTFIKQSIFESDLIFYDHKNLKKINVFRDTHCEVVPFKDILGLKQDLNFFLALDYKPATRKEFNDSFIKYTINLNNASKEI